MARGFAAEFTLEHPGFVLALAAIAGAFLYVRSKAAAASVPVAAGLTPTSPLHMLLDPGAPASSSGYTYGQLGLADADHPADAVPGAFNDPNLFINTPYAFYAPQSLTQPAAFDNG
jgi:hypothetical protein